MVGRYLWKKHHYKWSDGNLIW